MLHAVAANAQTTSKQTSVEQTTVNWNDVHQTIVGFGAAWFYHSGTLRRMSDPARDQILDLLYSPAKGIGLSIVHQAFQPEVSPSPGTFDWSQEDDNGWLDAQAQARGVMQFMYSSQTPPGWMKDNGSILAGGSLLRKNYKAFADFLTAYIKHDASAYGITIDLVAPTSEPDVNVRYQSSRWTGRNIHDFIKKNLYPDLRKNALARSARIVTPYECCWKLDYAAETMADRVTLREVFAFGADDYGGYSSSPLDTKGKPLIQGSVTDDNTDYSIADGIRWAENIYGHMTDAQSAAWLWWWATQPSGGELLIIMDPNVSTTEFRTTKRLYTIGNYSKFVRPGYVRIGVAGAPAEGVQVSAYKDPSTGDFAIIAINQNRADVPLTMSFIGFAAGAVTPWITSASRNLAPQPALNAGDGVRATLPAQSVTTFVGMAGSASPSPAN